MPADAIPITLGAGASGTAALPCTAGAEPPFNTRGSSALLFSAPEVEPVFFDRFVMVTSFSSADVGVLAAGFLAGAASVCAFEKVSETDGTAADVLGDAGADGFALGFKI